MNHLLLNHAVSNFVLSTFLDGLAEAGSRNIKIRNMVQLLPQFIRTIPHNLDILSEWWEQRNVQLGIVALDVHVDGHLTLHIFCRLESSKANTSPFLQVFLRHWIVKGNLENISSSVIWNLEFILSLFVDPVTLLVLDLLEKGLSFVHGRSWELWWPIVLWVIPGIHPWLLLSNLGILTLVRNMVLVVGQFIECISLLLEEINLGLSIAFWVKFLLDEKFGPFILCVPAITFHHGISAIFDVVLEVDLNFWWLFLKVCLLLVLLHRSSLHLLSLSCYFGVNDHFLSLFLGWESSELVIVHKSFRVNHLHVSWFLSDCTSTRLLPYWSGLMSHEVVEASASYLH